MGTLDRLILRDDQWERMSQHIIGGERTRGSSGRDTACSSKLCFGSCAPARPGVICRRCSVKEQCLPPLQHKGIWWRIFETMSDDPDFEYLIIDSTIIRAHQHAAGAKRGLQIRSLAVPAAA